jgi:hypothetical protein
MDLLEAGGDVGAEFGEGLDVFFEIQAGHCVLLFVRRRVQELSPEQGEGARVVSEGEWHLHRTEEFDGKNGR